MVARCHWGNGTRREALGRTPAMFGHGKSYRLVVPAKSSNNAAVWAAEGMEGRGLTKGNLDRQNLPFGLRADPGRQSAAAWIRHGFHSHGVHTRGKNRMR